MIGFPDGSAIKNLPANAGKLGLIPGLGRSGEGSGNPFQYSCLGNPMDRGAGWAAVHGVIRVRHIVAVQMPGHVRLFVTPWTRACQASLSFTISQSSRKLMFIESWLSH